MARRFHDSPRASRGSSRRTVVADVAQMDAPRLGSGQGRVVLPLRPCAALLFPSGVVIELRILKMSTTITCRVTAVYDAWTLGILL